MRMRWRWPFAVLLILAAGAAGDRPQPGSTPPVGAVGAGGEEPTDDLERNVRLLRKWKSDPEHYARLQRDLQAFHALSPDRQQQLRELDRDLHSLEPQSQHRLWEVLERYSLWYERLPEETRRRIEETTDRQERLQLIRELKEEQWLNRLPRDTRQKLKLELDLSAGKQGARAAIIAKYRLEETQRRQRIRKLIELRPGGKERPGKPARTEALPDSVKTFVEKELRPKLTPSERKALESAQGRWPTLVLLIEDLADRYSLRPLPGPPELWEMAASALPIVPDQVLREFALNELTAEDRSTLNLSLTDSESRERLTRAFFEKKPRELQKYRKQNKQLLSGK